MISTPNRKEVAQIISIYSKGVYNNYYYLSNNEVMILCTSKLTSLWTRQRDKGVDIVFEFLYYTTTDKTTYIKHWCKQRQEVGNQINVF